MASIFTFEPDPPRVSSPWLTPEEPGRSPVPRNRSPSTSSAVQEEVLSEYRVTKLEAEPQDGPTEYKLHLLLRPRRQYSSMSTTSKVPGSHVSRHPGVKLAVPSPSPTPTNNQTRQMRLEHLTTQLLWRLQQSMPYHASSSKDLVIPKLPDESFDLHRPIRMGKLIPGLEESQGALYEIGVADDGTFVGLAKDEMDESIATLRIMAASLGCKVEVIRMVCVGQAEWYESMDLINDATTNPEYGVRKENLWVAEAFVTPGVSLKDGSHPDGSLDDAKSTALMGTRDISATPPRAQSTTDQLRVTLTGPTTSGKSTLLGTLSMGTLDTGRGMSRLSLLRHRHEVVTGITSSVAQELIGYKNGDIFNYSHANIKSWIDIHDHSEHGRLAFVSDSAGHPRYRRTILRGLVGWAPHWTILCLAADDRETAATGDGNSPSAQDILGAAGSGIDLAKAHLDLCLKLETPLAIVITKLDLASKASLARLLGRVLTRVKEVGRVPDILKPDQTPHVDLTTVPVADADKVRRITTAMEKSGDLLKYVPIVLTSSVKGTGIGMTHALLQSLPLPPTPTANDFIGEAYNPEQPSSLFHIDDKYNLPATLPSIAVPADQQANVGTVVSGYLRFGRLSVGDRIVVGPFPADDDNPRGTTPDDRASPGNYAFSMSHPSSTELARMAMRNEVSASAVKGQWHDAHIVSIRNLRLPVTTLESGQVGTVGLVLDSVPDASLSATDPDYQRRQQRDIGRIRKGMVVAIPAKHMAETGVSLQAASGLVAYIDDPDALTLGINTPVNVYIASVRAVAYVRSTTLCTSRMVREDPSNTATEDIDDIFSLAEGSESGGGSPVDGGSSVAGVEIRLELLTNREWIEMGSKVVVVDCASKDRLDGYVGKVVEIFD